MALKIGESDQLRVDLSLVGGHHAGRRGVGQS